MAMDEMSNKLSANQGNRQSLTIAILSTCLVYLDDNPSWANSHKVLTALNQAMKGKTFTNRELAQVIPNLHF
jgi:hypothetical protein